MRCRIFRIFYGMVPVLRWRAYLLDRHLAGCSRCRAVLETEPVSPVGLTAGQVNPGIDLWSRVEDGILDHEVSQTPKHPSRARSWGWVKPVGWAFAGAAALVLVLVLTRPAKHEPGPGHAASPEKKIIIHSVTVENGPAKTYMFQPGNKDRLIVWVKKM